MLSAHLHGRHHIVDVARQHDADWHLSVIRSVGGIERAAPAVEAHVAIDHWAEIAGEIRRWNEARYVSTIGRQCRIRHWYAPQTAATPPTARLSTIPRCSFAQVCALEFALRDANRPCTP